MRGGDDLGGDLLGRRLAARARDLAVLLHQRAEAVDVDGLATLLGELLRELDREAVRRREHEGVVGGDRVLAGELLELLQPARERLTEALLLLFHDVLDLGGVLAQLGVGVGHLLDHDGRQPVHVLEPDALAVLHGAADDAARDVAAALVRRRDAVGDQERHRAAVVGEHAVRLRRQRAVAVGDAGLALDPVHDQPEAVGVEVRGGVLENHRAALEAEAGVDARARQRHEVVARPQVVLHEDEVVELHVAVALAARAAVGATAAVLLASVVEDLRARPARPRVRRLPEVVLAQAHDPLGRNADPLPRLDRDRVLVQPEHRRSLRARSPTAARGRGFICSVTNSQAKSTAPSLK